MPFMVSIYAYQLISLFFFLARLMVYMGTYMFGARWLEEKQNFSDAVIHVYVRTAALSLYAQENADFNIYRSMYAHTQLSYRQLGRASFFRFGDNFLRVRLYLP